MVVWRWEDEAGVGPYSGRGLFPFHSRLNRTPHPFDDGIRGGVDCRRHLFGFRSEEQAKQWFTPEEEAQMRKLGLKFVRYVVDDEHVVLGMSQLIFDHHHAKLV